MFSSEPRKKRFLLVNRLVVQAVLDGAPPTRLQLVRSERVFLAHSGVPPEEVYELSQGQLPFQNVLCVKSSCAFFLPDSGVNKSARERRGRQNLPQKVPSKKASLGVIFSPRNQREKALPKICEFLGGHSGRHLLGRPLSFTAD